MPHQKSEEGWLSVTEVLNLTIDKPYLAFWRGKVGNQEASRIQRESQEIGTEIHRMIEERFKGSLHKYDDRKGIMVNNFWTKFVEPYEVKPIRLEITLQDKKLKLQGTFDAVILSNKGTCLADWKTSNLLDRISVPLQLSAYSHLNDGIPNQGVVVRIDKESDEVEVKWYENLSDYWPVFKAAMKLARFIKFGEVR